MAKDDGDFSLRATETGLFRPFRRIPSNRTDEQLCRWGERKRKHRMANGRAPKCILYELLVSFQCISAGLHPPVYRVFQGGDPAADGKKSKSKKSGVRNMYT